MTPVKQNRLSLWYGFAPHVAEYPNELCIWSRPKSYTWKQVHDGAVQWAQFFLSKGVKPGDMIGVYLVNSADFLVMWLGLFCIGCAPALLNYNLKGEAFLHCLKVSKVKLVLVDPDEECQARFKEVEEKILEELNVEAITVSEDFLSKIYGSPVIVPDDSYRAHVKPANPVCLLYTSGTTGLPKAAPFMTGRYHERGNPENPPYNQIVGPKGDRWYCSMPLFHGTGGLALMMALTNGISTAVGRKFSVRMHWDDIYDSSSTIFVYVGEAARYLLHAPPHPLERKHPRLRAMYGNGLRPDVWSRFQARFGVPEVIEFFNSTEGVLGMVNYSTGPFSKDCVGRHGALLRYALSDIYVPVAIDAETGALLRDPSTGLAQRKSYDEGGEILVQVPDESAFAGYFGNPQATAKKFERNVLRNGDLYYRSGDALRRDADGRWFFLDRLGDTFRWKSENVSTGEVAAVLGAYPGVAEAIVYGVAVPGHDGKAGCAAVLLAEGVQTEGFNWKNFLEFARARLVKEAVPVFIRVVAGSSKTDNQKQNKGPLKKEGIDLESFGESVVGGEGDIMLWTSPGKESYEMFGVDDLRRLREGKFLL